MINAPLEILSSSPIAEGAYGYELQINTQTPFQPSPEPMPSIVIKKPTNPLIIRPMDTFDFDTGQGTFIVKQGDFNEPGRYILAVVQKGEDYAISSDNFTTIVNESLLRNIP